MAPLKKLLYKSDENYRTWDTVSADANDLSCFAFFIYTIRTQSKVKFLTLICSTFVI